MLYLYSKLKEKFMEELVFSSKQIVEKDTIDSYFECISECSIVNGREECITRCVEIHLKGDNQNE